MQSISTFLLTFIAYLMCSSVTNGQTTEIDEYLIEAEKRGFFSGSAVVVKGTEVLLNKGYGYADHEHVIRNGPSTVHRIGSLSKPMTAMALLKLFGEDDSRSLEDPIGKYLPQVPSTWGMVTVSQLLNHTSGIPDHFGDLDAVPVEDTYLEIEKVFKQNQDASLKSNPGEQYRYSNFGYVLLGRIAEVVSGLSYDQFMKRYLFEPLKMTTSFYDDPRVIIQNRGQGYRLKEGRLMNDKLKDPAGYSAGGLLSTTNDLVKWSKSFTKDLILTDSDRTKLFTPYKEGYGFGWKVSNKSGRTLYHHNGGTHGFSSRAVYFPQEQLFIGILSNLEDIRCAAFTCDMISMLLDLDHPKMTSIELGTDRLKEFTGRFKSADGDERSIEWAKNSLYMVIGTRRFELVPLSETTLCYKDYRDIRLTFNDKKVMEVSSCYADNTIYHRED